MRQILLHVLIAFVEWMFWFAIQAWIHCLSPSQIQTLCSWVIKIHLLAQSDPNLASATPKGYSILTLVLWGCYRCKEFQYLLGMKLLILRGTSNWHLKWSFRCVLHHDRKLFICLLPPGFSQSVPFFLHPFQLKNDSLVALKDHTCKRWGQIQLVINTVNSA